MFVAWYKGTAHTKFSSSYKCFEEGFITSVMRSTFSYKLLKGKHFKFNSFIRKFAFSTVFRYSILSIAQQGYGYVGSRTKRLPRVCVDSFEHGGSLGGYCSRYFPVYCPGFRVYIQKE